MAQIIGTASVRVTLDSTGFKTAVQKDVEQELQGAGNEDWMGPGLKKNEDEAKKSSVSISSIFAGMWAGVKTTTLSYLASLIPAAGNSLLQLSGVLGLVPALGAAGATAIAALAIGTHGFSQALKDVNNQAAFTKDLANLSPSARDAATAIKGLQGQFSNLRLDVQQQLFQGLGGYIKQIGSQYLPILDQGLSGTASGLNKFAQQTALFLKFPDVAGDFTNVFGDIKAGLANLVPAWNNVLIVMDDMVTVGARQLPAIGTSISNLVAKFGTFIDNARQSGQLAGWIQAGVNAFKQLFTIVGNVASVVLQLFTTLDSTGGNLLGLLASLTGQLKAFLASAQGQQLLQALALVLGTIARDVGPLFLLILRQLTPIVVQLAPLFAAFVNVLAGGLATALKVLGPLLLSLATYLNQHKAIVVPLTAALLALWGAYKLYLGLKAIITLFTLERDALAGMSIAQVIATASTVAFNAAMALMNIVLAAGRVAWALFTAVLDANPLILIGVVIVGLAVLIATHWKQTVAILTAIWNTIKAVAETVWNAIAGFFTGIWNAISGTAKTVWGAIAGFFTGLWKSITSAIQTAWIWVTVILGTLWRSVVDLTRPIWQPIVTFFVTLWNDVKNVIVAAWGFVSGFLIAAWNAFVGIVKAIWQPIADFFSLIWNGIKLQFITAWTLISGFLGQAWAAFTAVVQAVWQPISAFFTSIWDGIKNAFTEGWTVISTFLTGAWNAFVGIVKAIWQPIANFFTTLWDGIKAEFTQTWNAIYTILTTVWDKVSSFFGGIGSSIIHAIGNVADILVNIGKSIINGLLNGIKDAWKAVQNFFSGVGDWIAQHKGPIEKDRGLLVPAGHAIMGGFLDSLYEAMPGLTQFTNDVASALTGGLAGTSVSGGINLGVTSTPGADGSATVGGGPMVQINAYQQPGQDVLQFASTVSHIGAQQVLNAASTIAVTQQPVQIGATNKVVPVG